MRHEPNRKYAGIRIVRRDVIDIKSTEEMSSHLLFMLLREQNEREEQLAWNSLRTGPNLILSQ